MYHMKLFPFLVAAILLDNFVRFRR